MTNEIEIRITRDTDQVDIEQDLSITVQPVQVVESVRAGTGGSLSVEFDSGDVAAGSLEIGRVPALSRIFRAVLEIATPFDGATLITVGDEAGQARLMTNTDNDPGRAGSYVVEPDFAYPSETDLKLFFPSGSPTIGQGRAIIYY